MMRSLNEPWFVPMRRQRFSFFASMHERREFFLDALQFGGVLLVGVFLGGKFLGVGVIAGIDAHDFHPFHRFHRGFGLEMDVGDNRHVAAVLAQFGDDVLQIRRVLHRRRGDADELAADGDQFERLLHAQRGVHRVAGEHGLLHDGMVAADDDAAVRRIADDDFARLPALVKVMEIRSSAWQNYFIAAAEIGGRPALLGGKSRLSRRRALRTQSPVSKNAM